LDAVEDGLIQGVISIISIAELCAGYYSQDDKEGKEELLAHLISNKDFVIVDLDLKIADAAAKIRADTGLRLPDAVIIATALAKGVRYLVTNDKGLKKASCYLEVISSKEMFSKINRARQKK
jgi:predicted nucleic acid-binding protein